MAYEDRVKQYQVQIAPERNKHIARNIRQDYPEIPQDLSDEDVLKAHRNLFGEGLNDEDYSKRLNAAYASDFEPTTKPPEPNLIEKAQAIAPQVPHIAKEMAVGAAPFLAAQIGSALTKVPGVGQLGLAANTAVKMAGMQKAGTELEKTAAEMPQPNVQNLVNKGYSDAQIHAVLKGYADVQRDIYNEVEQIGSEGITAGAEGIANAALFKMGAGKIERMEKGLAGGQAVGTGARAIAARAAGQVAGHAASGATFGAAFTGTQTATERMAQAKAAGLGANDILKAGMGGLSEGAIGTPGHRLGSGAALGAIIGGIIGAPVAAVSTGREVAQTVSAARKAAADAAIEDARRLNLQNFARDFKPTDLASRFSEDLAAANGDDALLARNIVAATQGKDIAVTEDGMRAASQIYQKILAWRQVRNSLNKMITPADDIGPRPLQNQALPPGAALNQEGGLPPEPNVAGVATVEPGLQPFVPPANVPQVPGLGPVGNAVPTPERPLAVEPTAIPPGAPPAPTQPLGVVPSGQPAVEPAARELPVAEAPTPTMRSPEAAPPLIAGPQRAMEISGTPAEREAFQRAQQTPSAPAEGLAPSAAPSAAIEPREINLPTQSEVAAKRLSENTGVEVAPTQNGLSITKLGVKPGEIAKIGSSSDALSRVNAVADEHGLPVEARLTPQAGPRGGTIPLEKLIPWYEQHGYAVTEKGEGYAVVRREPSNPTIAERAAGLPAEEARMAAGNVYEGHPLAQAGFGERLGKFLTTQSEAAQKRIASRGVRLYAMGLDPANLADHSIVAAAEMFTKGMRTKAAVGQWLVDTYGEHIRPHIDKIFEAAQKRLLKMFKTEGKATKRLGELVALRDSGAHGMDWYEDTAKYVEKEFGPDSDMFLRFLAATSAGSSTETGASLALKAYAQWKHGLPFDGMRGQHMVMMLDQAARGERFGGDKVASFYEALKGDTNAVVLDRWMIHALGLPIKKGSLGDNDYRLYSQIVRNLAEDAGMTPRQFQAAVWEGARVGEAHKRWKALGPKGVSKIGSARPLEQLVQKEFGNMTPYQWVQHNRMRLEDLNNMTNGLKAARQNGGYTFNPGDWTTDKTPGYVVTLLSDVVPKKEFYPSALTKFKAQVQKLLTLAAFGDDHLNIGTFDMGEHKPGHFSLDLNVVIPNSGPEALARAKAIGKMNRQFEIGEIGPDGGYVQGHSTGYDPKKQGPQFVPPAKGPERSAWFKAAVGRARTLLDHLDFKLKG